MPYKKNYLLIIFFLCACNLIPICLLAQGAMGCDGMRYNSPIFSTSVDLGVNYGNAPQATLFNPNATMDLDVDIYQPVGDTLSKRPLIIWAFGGSFVFGSSLSPDIVTLCEEFTKMGYVNASIDYRLTTDLIWNNNTDNAYKAVMKAAHDMKAAIRFFYKDAATSDVYRIDTSRIFIGGVSAGGIAAVHVAYLDEISEVPSLIYNEYINNGGLEGNSGNPGYSSDVAGVINLCGALLDTTMMKSGDEPLVSLHGTNDGTVPYNAALITTLGVNLFIHGSSSMHDHADNNINLYNEFYSWQGAGHTPFVSDADYMDTTVQFVRDFLYTRVCPSNVEADVTAYLEGAYLGNGLMSTDLNPQIDLVSPYINPPYSAPLFFSTAIPADAVDWVQLEVRTGEPSLAAPRMTQTIAQGSGFLMEDGSIREQDGITPLSFDLILGDSYHVAIRHRNHLDVLSNTSWQVERDAQLPYDFTTGIGQAFGTQQLKMVNGASVLFAGDMTQDHTIQTTDFDAWILEPALLNTYHPNDVNLDGAVQATDYDLWYLNKAKIGNREMDY